MRWPKFSDISMEPADISPLKLMQDMMEKRKTNEKPKAAADEAKKVNLSEKKPGYEVIRPQVKKKKLPRSKRHK